MTLISSISGLRGTIGGEPKNNLTPIDVVNFTSAFASLLKKRHQGDISIVVGRDARISGLALKNQVISTLIFCGVNVIDIDLATTPTVELTVINKKAQGGIILTASHNPKDWNALKLLNEKGEFISGADGSLLLDLIEIADFSFAKINNLGKVEVYNQALEDHIEAILKLPLVDKDSIAKANFKIVVDGINSVGALAIPSLLKLLGVSNVIVLNNELNGEFAHNPEPLAENLVDTCKEIISNQVDLGIVVDPDVDRLAFINEEGEMFGEEYTLVAVSDYVLSNFSTSKYKKITVSNMSSSRALKDLSEKHNASYESAPVGEVNVVNKMKEVSAVIGGEGNGGVIYPELHYGRDALVGVALFLSYLAKTKKKVSQLRNEYKDYIMIKHKISISSFNEAPAVIDKLKNLHQSDKIDLRDGLKIEWNDAWLHIRPSNTEPIMRLYIEASTNNRAQEILQTTLKEITS